MTIEEIDARIEEKDRAFHALRAEMQALWVERARLADEAKANEIMDSLTPSQRNAVIRVGGMKAQANIPKAE